MRAQTVYENIEFKRGRDPKHALGIGKIAQFIKYYKDYTYTNFGGTMGKTKRKYKFDIGDRVKCIEDGAKGTIVGIWADPTAKIYIVVLDNAKYGNLSQAHQFHEIALKKL